MKDSIEEFSKKTTVKNGISPVNAIEENICSDKIGSHSNSIKKSNSDSLKTNGNRSRIPRPEISYSGFQQNDDILENFASQIQQSRHNYKNKNRKGRRSSVDSRYSFPGTTSSYPRSETGTSLSGISSLERAFDQAENKSKTLTYSYKDMEDCPLHSTGKAESVYTVGADSDPGPSTGTNQMANTPVLVSGVIADSLPKKKNASSKRFNSYMSLEEIQKGLKKGEVLEGVLRINQRNYEDAYISSPQADQGDIYIGGIHDRNRALHGDVVAVQLKPPEKWKINEEAILDYEMRNGPLFSSIDQVDGAIASNSVPLLTPNCDLVKNDKKASNSNASQEKQSKKRNRKKKSKKQKNADSNVNWNVNETPQPHTVQIFGLEQFQQQVDDFKNNKTIDDNQPKTWTTEENSSFTVLPTDLLKNSQGDFIGNADIADNLSSGNEYPECNAVAPDQLSGCEFSLDDNDDANSLHSIDRHLEDTEFFNANAEVDSELNEIDTQPNAEDKNEQNENDVQSNQRSQKKKKKRKRKKKNDKKEAAVKRTDVSDVPPKCSYSLQQIINHPLVDKFVQKTAVVVAILEFKHLRIVAGHLKLQADNSKFVMFSPCDSRIPRMLVPTFQCPPEFLLRESDFKKSLFMASIVDWPEHSKFAFGKILKYVGERGKINTETEAILIENGVDFSEFPPEVVHDLPSGGWQIPKEELKSRKDFRKDCVFTIDPATARDLDDALSCQPLGNGTYRIGVHIADVSHFVKENTLLDAIAASRATSVYLVQQVVPMLPRVLCEQLCSLNPGVDRLTFSVHWDINEKGEILNEWFGKGIINSCVKLTYDHAQDMIMEEENESWVQGKFPTVTNNWTYSHIGKSVKKLNQLACVLRQNRFKSGTLLLNQTTIKFHLEEQDGFPYAYSTYEQKDSHRLVEEFMLLANMAVAHYIYKAFPENAFLRRHPEPKKQLMSKISEMCSSFGLIMNDSSSGSLQASLQALEGDDLFSRARYEVLCNMYSKPMNCAKYFCAGSIDDPMYFRHYALSVPLYTHFTSPIRRYPDIVVHRQLARALKIAWDPNVDKKLLQKQADFCNDKKLNAKVCSDLSTEMFLAMFVHKCGPLREKAMVVAVMDRSFDVLIIQLGSIKRIYCDKLLIKHHKLVKVNGVPQLHLTWHSTRCHSNQPNNTFQQVLSIFCLVDVELTGVADNVTKFNTVMMPPADAVLPSV